MRKILFALAIVALLIFTGIVMYKGTSGNLNIWGFTNISEENDIIDKKNLQLGALVNTTYPQTVNTLNTSANVLEKTKKEYEDQAVLLADSKYFKQTENYKHEFILVKIGNYADENGVDIRIVVTNSDVAGLYDVNFTLTGRYADVANYIYDIENDSTLGFKIEDFIMKKSNGETQISQATVIKNEVIANFNCKEISIDLKWLDENEKTIPGIITRGNPFITDKTTLTGEYANDPEESRNLRNSNTSNTTNTTNTTNGNTTTNTNTNTTTNTTGTNTTTNTTANTTNTSTGNTTNDSVYNTSVKEVDNRRDTNEPSASAVIDNAAGQP